MHICQYQHTVGNIGLVLNTHKEIFSELNENEIVELGKLIKLAQKILTTEFKPDWFNIQQNGNWFHHLHFNIMPRYKDKRVFNGLTFVDKTFQHPITYTSKDSSKTFIQTLTNALKKHL